MGLKMKQLDILTDYVFANKSEIFVSQQEIEAYKQDCKKFKSLAYWQAARVEDHAAQVNQRKKKFRK